MTHKVPHSSAKLATLPEFKIPSTTIAELNDNTFRFFRDMWIRNVKETKKRFGSFKAYGVGQLYGINAHRPAIVIGSGPSITKNAMELKRAKKQGITLVSCLHNYPYLLDREIVADYYVTTDALGLTTDQISDGGKLTRTEYLESTKDKTLIAATWTHPVVFEDWKGKVLLYNLPQDRGIIDSTIQAIEPFNTNVSCGGTVLRA